MGGDADRSGTGQERNGTGVTGRELRLMNRFCSPRPVPVPFIILLKIEMGQDGRWEGTGTGTDERSAGVSFFTKITLFTGFASPS